MNYGDELNDEEEKSYRKELIEKRRREKLELEQMLKQPKVLPKRESRGKRMTALVGKAIEEDENFWNQGIFADPAGEEGSGDDDFESA